MHPGLFIIAAGAAAYMAFRPKPMTDAERAMAMTRLPDLIYKIITKVGSTADRSGWAIEAVEVAQRLGMPKTAQGIVKGALPADEMWPGTGQTVPSYMHAYVESRKPKAATAKTYNDEPAAKPVRARALAAQSSNPAQAKVLHIQADTINTVARAKKMREAGKTAVKALSSLV